MNWNCYTSKEYQMAAIYGLDNAGIMPANFSKEYQDLFNKNKIILGKLQNPLIDLNAALNSNIALYNLDEYSNEKEAKIDFLNRTYHQPQKKAKSWDVKDMIYLSPSIYNMRKVQ
jgi:uncharacterized membrane protein YgaE (UPF0421/DUF939 family)